MKETAKRKNVKLYNHYINEAAKRKSLPLARNLFEQLKSQSLQPNEFTYTCMINACSRSSDMKGAEWYLRAMQDEKLAPNEITWTALIKGATAAFDIPTAIKFLEEMRSSGVPPNLRTYNTILRACFRVGDAPTANDLVKNHMKLQSIKPDFTSLQTLTQIQAQAMLTSEAFDTAAYLEALLDAKKVKDSKTDKSASPASSSAPSKAEDSKSSSKNKNEKDKKATDTKKPEIVKFEKEFIIDPSLYLLLASTALLSGSMLKKVRQYMDKFDAQVALLKAMASEIKSADGNTDSEPVALEMLMEANYIRPYLEKNEGLAKKAIEITKLGATGSPFVKHFDASSTSSTDYLWPVDKATKDKKRRLEICSGSGDWVIARAQKDDANWAALEIRFDRVHEIWRRVSLNKLEDRVTVIHADAAHLEKMVPKGSVDEIFINFPDPPHTRWSAQRMVTPTLLRALATVLVPGGTVVIATDDFDYIRWVHEDSKSLGDYFDPEKTVTSKSIEGYGTSYFDGLWSSRGRTDRAFLTLTAL